MDLMRSNIQHFLYSGLSSLNFGEVHYNLSQTWLTVTRPLQDGLHNNSRYKFYNELQPRVPVFY